MRFSGFSGFSRFARLAGIAIAIAAIIDPVLSLSRQERPPIRIVTAGDADITAVSASLRRAGFPVNAGEPEAATLIVGDHPPPRLSLRTEHSALSTPLWAIDTGPRAPNVRVVRASAAAVRLPEQAVEVSVELIAEGMAGQSTEISLQDAGIAVANIRHTWTGEREKWRATLQYLPPGSSSARLRVTAAALRGETSTDDNAVDVALPAARGPVRMLVVEAGVTWPAVFVRRALEGEAAFAVSALQRASKSVAIRAGSPPAALTRGTLSPFEVALVGGPDNLTAPDLDALRWFVEARGGVVVFVPDQRPAGRYVDLSGVDAFESRVVEAPLALTEPGKNEASLSATELVVPKSLPTGASMLAADPGGAPVVFAARRGAGAVIVSGALDAWRYRSDDRFARFWRRVIAEQAATVPPALDVTADPMLVRPGDTTIITARIRGSEVAEGDRIDVGRVSARAVDPQTKTDVPIRLWPSVEPGVFVGEWRPPTSGMFNVAVTAGPLRGDALLTAARGVAPGSAADPEALALITRASGGRVVPSDQLPELTDAMKATYPPRQVTRTIHPMRSTRWAVAFAFLLCVEWAIRRKHGLS